MECFTLLWVGEVWRFIYTDFYHTKLMTLDEVDNKIMEMINRIDRDDHFQPYYIKSELYVDFIKYICNNAPEPYRDVAKLLLEVEKLPIAKICEDCGRW